MDGRQELKFLVDPLRLRQLRGRLGPFLRPDPHDPLSCGYPVLSLYYDSADLVFARDKLESVGMRRKVRLRFYGAPGEGGGAWLEIKEKAGSIVRKKRAAVQPGPAAAAPWDLSRWCGGGDAVSREVAWIHARLRLRPAVWVEYQRQAWVGRSSAGRLRLTADRGLLATAPDTAPEGWRRALDPAHRVVELKVNGAVPAHVAGVLAALDLQQVKYSKYLQCLLARGRPLPRRPLAAAAGPGSAA